MWWNYWSIPKLQRFHRWSLGMDKYFSTLYWIYDYLSMPVLNLNHISDRDSKNSKRLHVFIMTEILCKSSYFLNNLSEPSSHVTHLEIQMQWIISLDVIPVLTMRSQQIFSITTTTLLPYRVLERKPLLFCRGMVENGTGVFCHHWMELFQLIPFDVNFF